jgi:hypothetical protein
VLLLRLRSGPLHLLLPLGPYCHCCKRKLSQQHSTCRNVPGCYQVAPLGCSVSAANAGALLLLLLLLLSTLRFLPCLPVLLLLESVLMPQESNGVPHRHAMCHVLLLLLLEQQVLCLMLQVHEQHVKLVQEAATWWLLF